MKLSNNGSNLSVLRPSRLFVLAALILSGCAIADFTPYSGGQQNWPTATGAFVKTDYAVPAYLGYPNRPYNVIGYLDTTTAPIRDCSNSYYSCLHIWLVRDSGFRSTPS